MFIAIMSRPLLAHTLGVVSVLVSTVDATLQRTALQFQFSTAFQKCRSDLNCIQAYPAVDTGKSLNPLTHKMLPMLATCPALSAWLSNHYSLRSDW
jgi:hypothetical protein